MVLVMACQRNIYDSMPATPLCRIILLSLEYRSSRRFLLRNRLEKKKARAWEAEERDTVKSVMVIIDGLLASWTISFSWNLSILRVPDVSPDLVSCNENFAGKSSPFLCFANTDHGIPC